MPTCVYEEIFICKAHNAKATRLTQRGIIFAFYTIADLEDISYNKSHSVVAVTCSLEAELKRKSRIKQRQRL